MHFDASIDPATRAEIEALITEMAWRIDHGQAAAVVELFTEEGRFAAAGLEVEGREKLAAMFARRTQQTHQSRHLVSNLRLLRESPTRIRGTHSTTVYRREAPDFGPASVIVADGEDVYERTPDGDWRFASRRLTPRLTAQAPDASGARRTR
jgi:ketosteroid isomerase-like protein